MIQQLVVHLSLAPLILVAVGCGDHAAPARQRGKSDTPSAAAPASTEPAASAASLLVALERARTTADPVTGVFTHHTALVERAGIADPEIQHTAPGVRSLSDLAERAPQRHAVGGLMRFLPPFFKAHYGTDPFPERGFTEGPNCWNTVFGYNDPDYPVRYTDDVELIQRLQSDYELVTPPLWRGDIITLWFTNRKTAPAVSSWQRNAEASIWQPLHSAVFVGRGDRIGDAFFSKKNYFPDTVYEMTSFGRQFAVHDTALQNRMLPDAPQLVSPDMYPELLLVAYTVHRKKQ